MEISSTHMSVADSASSLEPRARSLTSGLVGSHVPVGRCEIVSLGDSHNSGLVRRKIPTEGNLTHNNYRRKSSDMKNRRPRSPVYSSQVVHHTITSMSFMLTIIRLQNLRIGILEKPEEDIQSSH